MKRRISVILLLSFVLLLWPALPVSAAATVASGRSGGLEWILDDTGLLTISGEGPMEDYCPYIRYANGKQIDPNPAPWFPDVVKVFFISSVVVREGVTSLGSYAFADCTDLISVSLPQSLTQIGEFAFLRCYSMTGISLPQAVTQIGRGAFGSCFNLTSIVLPRGLTEISDDTFLDCAGLSSITLPEGLTRIGSSAFMGCYQLADIAFPASLTTIGRDAFSGTQVVLPDLVGKSSGLEWTLDDSGLLTIRGSGPMPDYMSRTALAIPDETVIGISILEGYTASSLPALKPETAGENAFSATLMPGMGDYSQLPKFPFGDDLSFEEGFSEGMDAIWDMQDMSGWNPAPWLEDESNRRITSVVIEEGITSVGSYAFQFCSELTHVSLPKSVKTIGNSAFFGCSNLTSVPLPEGLEKIDDYAFFGCGSLTKLSLPEGLTQIGELAFFSCGQLTEVSLPESLTRIGDYAFSWCGQLTKVSLPDSLTRIGNYAFFSCKNLTEVSLPRDLTQIGDCAFCDCESMTGLSLPAGLKEIRSSAFQGCRRLQNVVLPDSLTDLGEAAFKGSPAILPATGGRIGELEWTVDDNGLLTIRGSGPMMDFSQTGSDPAPWRQNDYSLKVTSVRMEDGITSVGSGAFMGCINMTSLTLPNSLTQIGEYAFMGCSGLTNLTLPKSLTHIGSSAFESCSSMTKLTLPESLTQIGRSAFDSCTSLTSVQFPDRLIEIEGKEFYFSGCDMLEHVYVPGSVRASEPVESNNCGRNEYDTYGAVVYSGLCRNGDELIRFENVKGRLLVETYSSDLRLLSSQYLDSDLTVLWGGFFIGEEYNFVITGQENPEEDDSIPVFAVTKYDKQWNNLGIASLRGANTTIPFWAGSLRCAEAGDMLYVHTCHQMYGENNNRHQANITFCIRESDMVITDARFDVSGFSGYVSHSFNQFILIDEEQNIVTLDHGDGYPRSAVLQRYRQKAAGITAASNDPLHAADAVEIQRFPGAKGDNTTGASLGGLAETSAGYLAAYNYNGVGALGTGSVMGVATKDPEPVRNVYLSYTPKARFSEEAAKVRKITAYEPYESGGSLSGGTPVLVSLGLEGGYILWDLQEVTENEYGIRRSRTGTICYARYAADGSVGEIRTAKGALSDCPPICVNGKIIWYVTEDSVPTFYVLDESGLTAQRAGWQAPESIKVRTDGELVWWTDAEPFIDANSRTMVPLRAVAEALGLTVTWDGTAREAAFTDGVRTLIFPIGSSVARTGDGGTVAMDTAAVIVSSRTYAPIRYLAEFFGYKVDWDGKTRTVLLTKSA